MMQPDTVIVMWSVSVVTYDPETYVVRYGTTDTNLDLVSDRITGFHAELRGLLDNTVYYFKVEATNSIGTAASTIGSFETPPSKFCMIHGKQESL